MRTFIADLFEPQTNVTEASKLLADLLSVRISRSTLKKSLEEHADYASLLSISDVLDNYGISNITATFDMDDLDRIPLPFITQVRRDNSDVNLFGVVKEVSDNRVRFFDPEIHQWKYYSRKDFFDKWSGIVLIAEAGEEAGEKEYDKQVRAERSTRAKWKLIALCIPVLFMIEGLSIFLNNGLAAILPFLFALLSLAGAGMGVLLLWYELDQYNPALQQICTAGRKVNCRAILRSGAATIGGISWSAIGFVYFTGSLLFLLLSGIADRHTLFVLSWMSMPAAAYMPFSIYYQWRVVKQWCVLCLGVQLILFLQLLIVLIAGWGIALPLAAVGDLRMLASLALAFIIPVFFTGLLLPVWQKSKEGQIKKGELRLLKNDFRVFEALLAGQKIVTESPAGLGITLGHPDAKYKIIKVCNAYCGPCARAHAPLEKLLENNPDVQVQIIFMASNAEGDVRTAITRHLLAIAEKNDEEQTKQALDDWYLRWNKDYASFAARYPMNGELNRQNDKITAMQDWCGKTGIAYTPMFFVNGHQLSPTYTINDLKYFLSI